MKSSSGFRISLEWSMSENLMFLVPTCALSLC